MLPLEVKTLMKMRFAMKVVYFIRPWRMPLKCFMSTIAYSLYFHLPTSITWAIGRVVIVVPNLVVSPKQCVLIQYGGYWLLRVQSMVLLAGSLYCRKNYCGVCKEATKVPPLVCNLADVELEIFVCAHGARRLSSFEGFWSHLQRNLTSTNFVPPSP